jgi:very-short-patch-repair endonuclease
MVKSNASVEELLAFTRRRLKECDAFAVGVFGSQIWKVLQRTRGDQSLNEAQEVMKDVLRASQPLLKSFKARNLVGLFYGCAKLQMRAEDFPRRWLEDWGTCFCGCIGQAKSQDLANTAYAVGILKALVNVNFWRVLTGEAKRKISSFNAQDLSNTAYAIGILGLKSSDLADRFWKSVSSRLEHLSTSSLTMDPQDISNFLYGAALSSFAASAPVIDSETVLRLGKIVIGSNSKMQVTDAQQLIQSFVWFNLEVPDAVRKALRTNDSSSTTTSRLQQRVSSCLEKPHQDEYWIDELAVPVDICIPDERHVIQVDGPSHFDQYGELKLRDKFATALLEKSGWKVTRIRYDEVDKVERDPELEEWLEEKLK